MSVFTFPLGTQLTLLVNFGREIRSRRVLALGRRSVGRQDK